MIDFQTSVLQQEKRCIFCGEPPAAKNKEHVIPKWLIELTGDPKRQWHLGVKFGDTDKPHRRFAADQFQFPACEACNTKYSDLEGRAKGHVVQLLNNSNLTANEWDDLLDWFDKVRIGLFIGNMILNKELPIPEPNFYIDQRLGKKDRCVLVYPHRDDYTGFNMIGGGDPVFFHHPSTLMLIINNLIFLNVSTDFLLSARMGFPYPLKTRNEGNRSYIEDFRATYKPKLPLTRFSFYPPKIGVYQTVLMDVAADDKDYAAVLKNDFIREKRMKGSNIKTRICVIKDGAATFVPENAIVESVQLQAPYLKTLEEHYLRFFDYRERLLDEALARTPESRKFIKVLKRFNNDAIAQVKAGIGAL